MTNKLIKILNEKTYENIIIDDDNFLVLNDMYINEDEELILDIHGMSYVLNERNVMFNEKNKTFYINAYNIENEEIIMIMIIIL
jgi:hypothetical protein